MSVRACLSVAIVSAVAGGELVAGHAVGRFAETTASDEKPTGDAVEQTRERPEDAFAEDGRDGL